MQLHHDEQLAIVLRMPFSSGHEISSLCCTQLPTVSPVLDIDSLAVHCADGGTRRPPGPLPPPLPPPLPKPRTSSTTCGSVLASATSDEDRSSAPLHASDDTSPTDHAQHAEHPFMHQGTPESLRTRDQSCEQYGLHNTRRPVSAASSRTNHWRVVDGDSVQSFWPQSLAQDGTMLVCREYLWVPSTLYRTDDKSLGAATAVHLLSVMYPHLHAYAGSSEMRYALLSICP